MPEHQTETPNREVERIMAIVAAEVACAARTLELFQQAIDESARARKLCQQETQRLNLPN